MFKLLGAILLIICCGALGLIKALAYSRRVKELSSIRDALKMLNTEISYRKDPLPVIFDRIAAVRDDIAGEIFKRCCHYMGQRLDLETCWHRAVDDACSESSLTAADRAAIYGIGAQMGRSDIKGQNEVILLTEEKLKYQIEDALKDKNSKGKMYGGLGFTIGILIAVLLI